MLHPQLSYNDYVGDFRLRNTRSVRSPWGTFRLHPVWEKPGGGTTGPRQAAQPAVPVDQTVSDLPRDPRARSVDPSFHRPRPADSWSGPGTGPLCSRRKSLASLAGSACSPPCARGAEENPHQHQARHAVAEEKSAEGSRHDDLSVRNANQVATAKATTMARIITNTTSIDPPWELDTHH